MLLPLLTVDHLQGVGQKVATVTMKVPMLPVAEEVVLEVQPNMMEKKVVVLRMVQGEEEVVAM